MKGTVGVTRKLLWVVKLPAPLYTAIGPVVAAAGTVTSIWFWAGGGRKLAATPLNVTWLIPVKFSP